MENLRRTLEILFLRANPEDALESWYEMSLNAESLEMSKELYADIAMVKDENFTRDEYDAMYKMAKDNWFYCNETGVDKRHNVFYPILNFANKVLKETNENIFCRFEQLLRWREITFILGEDMFTTAYLANLDLVSKRKRHFFAWLPILSTDNFYINGLKKKGFSELHCHLYGSSLNYDIGWLSLMNDISNRCVDFEYIKKSKFAENQLRYVEDNILLYTHYVKAFAIRLFLFRVLSKTLSESEFESFVKILVPILKATKRDDLRIYIPELIKEVTLCKEQFGKKYGGSVIDYAIRTNLSERSYNEEEYCNVILSGERWIMYKMFQKIYSNNQELAPLYPLFYAYLIIKSRIRQEKLQLNKSKGFGNFRDYQQRNHLFIKENSIYEKLINYNVIANAYCNQGVKYLETRITPSLTPRDDIAHILKLDADVACKQFMTPIKHKGADKARVSDSIIAFSNYFYIYHFIRDNSEDNNPIEKECATVLCRLTKLRDKIKRQAKALNIIRKLHVKIANRIVAIDAANTEIGTRPEVFAQAFRYLKKYSYEDENYQFLNRKRNTLCFTYHVGEDFLDLADGLRAIDEVIKFLQFSRGDRLGHAIALAVNPSLYYTRRSYQVVMPKMDLLDNIVWLLMQVRKFNISISQALLQKMEELYWKLFCEIYTDIEGFDILMPFEIYYQSWLLRGDNPYLYLNKDFNPDNFKPLTFWERCGLNDDEIYNAVRKNKMAVKLYRAYHFNPDVKENGRKTAEYAITPDYVILIEQIQYAMQRELSAMHIAIETNPTSNKLIGPIDKYIEHPIFNLYNLHIEHDMEKCRKCSQLSVSVNTDDLGVFGTSLENEYALLAIALEKEKDENGKKKYHSRCIYNWLESIRQMGEEQRFMKE